MDYNNARKLVLEIIQSLKHNGGSLQSGTVLHAITERQKNYFQGNEQELYLTVIHDLFRQGFLAPGINLSNPSLPFFHVTSIGSESLKQIDRDPCNPAGYLAYLNIPTNEIVREYVTEAVDAFNAGLFKSSAVMVGAAAECIVFDLKDVILNNIIEMTPSQKRDLSDWKAKTVLTGIQNILNSKKSQMEQRLTDEYESNMPAFTYQIRRLKNDVGHPVNIQFFTYADTHAALLIFPALYKLSKNLENFIIGLSKV